MQKSPPSVQKRDIRQDFDFFFVFNGLCYVFVWVRGIEPSAWGQKYLNCAIFFLVQNLVKFGKFGPELVKCGTRIGKIWYQKW